MRERCWIKRNDGMMVVIFGIAFELVGPFLGSFLSAIGLEGAGKRTGP